ncbi:hypothetical protein RRG08_049579 [Elysia crispata]|uniref:Uncharacterized protein n=1 Tax=Elysia crispata TaxID=231223 RepID=A0AAE1AUX8_9GAST|nr:hypothetical protein RRG08_049579 [Elysia crispata]
MQRFRQLSGLALCTVSASNHDFYRQLCPTFSFKQLICERLLSPSLEYGDMFRGFQRTLLLSDRVNDCQRH